MFESYSYKVKCKALLVLFAVLSYTAYKRSFSTLLATLEENAVLNDRVEEVSIAPNNINVLEAEIASIDKIVGKGGTDKEKVQQGIVNFVTMFDTSISIFDLQAIHEFQDNNFYIFTYQIDVTGSLNSLLALSYEFEKKFEYSRLVSISFYTTKKNNKPDILHLKMIFQNYENKE